MSKWYYQINSQVHGPVSFGEIEALVKEGTLSMLDMVFQDGDERWRVLIEVPGIEKRSAANSSLAGIVDLPKKGNVLGQQWILLVKIKDKDETKFVQKGPFDLGTVIKKLEERQVKYSDYAWNAGFTEWKRIGSLDEFDRRKRRASEKKPLDAGVKKWVHAEPRPDGAEGDDLAGESGVKPFIPESPYEKKVSVKEDLVSRSSPDEKIKNDVKSFVDSIPAWPEESLKYAKQKNRVKSWNRKNVIGGAAITVCFFASLGLYFSMVGIRPPIDKGESNYLNSSARNSSPQGGQKTSASLRAEKSVPFAKGKEVPPERKVEKKTGKPIVQQSTLQKGVMPHASQVDPVEKKVEVEVAKAPSVPIGASSYIRLENTDDQSLKIISDVPKGKMIELLFEGRNGQVYDSPGFLGSFKYWQNDNGITTVRFSSKRIPHGKYKVMVKSGALSDSIKSMNVGASQKLSKVRKRWSMVRNREKLKLYYKLKSFDSILEKLAGQKISKKVAIKRLNKLKESEYRLARKSVIRKLAYPKKWKQLRDYMQRAENLLTSSKRVKRTMASDPAIKLRVSVKALKKQAGKITVYR